MTAGERTNDDGPARVLLDELAEELIAGGFPENRAFAVEGRRRSRCPVRVRPRFIGFADGLSSCWCRESAERNIVARSEELATVRDVVVRAVEDEAESDMSQFEEKK